MTFNILCVCLIFLNIQKTIASGTRLKCPEGQSSPTGFAPNCEEVPIIPLLPSVAAGLATGPQHNVTGIHGYTMEHKVLKFDCILQSEPDNAADLLFMVEWFIENNPVDSFSNKSFAELKDTYLTGEKWKGKAHMGFHVKAKMRAKYKDKTVYGPVFESEPFYAGFKVESSNVEVKEGESKDIKIWLTVPFGCLRPNHLSDDVCSALELNLRERKYQRSQLTSGNLQCGFDGSLEFLNQNCKLTFKHTKWEEIMTISIKGKSDSLYNTHDRISHIRLEASEVFYNDPGFGGASLPDIVVKIRDVDNTTIRKQCRSANDPQITTFDNIIFQNHYIGEQVLYKHNELPIVVHIMITGCEGAASGTCNCGVAIRNDNAMFIANFCGTIARPYVVNPSNRYIEKVNCDDKYMTIKETGSRYEVTLPTGTSVTFDCDIRRNIISYVYIKPSILDWEKSSGLCGFLDGNQANDMKLRDGSTTNNKNEFFVHWRITDTRNSLFEPNTTLQKSGVSLRQYCKCNTDVTEADLDVLCHLTDAMIPCKETTIDAETARGFFKQCGKSRTKRDVYTHYISNREEDDDDDFVDKIAITYADNYLEPPQAATWTNGWNDTFARQTCTAYIDGSKMVDLCNTFIPEFSTDITNTIEECVNDIKSSGGTYFMEIALKSLIIGCVVEAKKFENLTDTNSTSRNSSRSLLDDILDSSCPNNCSGQGECVKGICQCINDFHGNECNLKRSDAPNLSQSSYTGLCKTDQKSCHSYGIIGNYMIPGLLKCKARHFKIFTNGIVDRSGSDLVFPGTYINEFSCKCVIPGSRKRRSTNPETVVADGYHISVSNDGVTYSEEITIVNYDSTCYECNSTDIACTFIGVDDKCTLTTTMPTTPKPTKDLNPGEISGIVADIIFFMIIVAVLTIIIIYNRTKSETGAYFALPTTVANPSEEDFHDIIQTCKVAIEIDNTKELQSIIDLHFQTEETKNRRNILLIAAAIGSTTMCNFLLSQGFPFDTRTVNDEISTILFGFVNSNKESPLSIAVQFKKLENIQILVSTAEDADIEVISKQEQEVETILMDEIRKRLELRFKRESLGVVAGFRKTKGIIVVYKDSMDIDVLKEKEQSFCGRTLIVKNPKLIPPSDENERPSNCYLSVDQMDIGKQVINDNAKDLWSHHSNLNIITMQAVPDDQGRDREPKCCIVLYCTSKGIVPLGQKEFPKTMKTKYQTHELSVKVEEGFFDYCPSYTTSSSTTFHQDLKMGCSISRQNATVAGTIGPFIEINGAPGFLTCAHVLIDIPPSGRLDYDNQITIRVLQPEEGSLQTTSSPFNVARNPCGNVYKAKFDPTLEVGVDAAAVWISDTTRNPIEGRFAIDREDTYKKIGFAEPPVFNSGRHLCRKDISRCKKVVKCGSQTHLTQGIVQFDGTQVRRATFNGKLDQTNYVMKNQIEIDGVRPDVFCRPGDSGSAVFQMNEDFSLECIGMVIGMTSQHTTIVTPISDILGALGVQLKKFV